MPFTDYFYDRYFAKGFGRLQKQSIPKFPDDLRKFGVQQFLLRTVFVTGFEEKARVRSFNAVRRILNAIEEYELARVNYESIFEGRTTKMYLKALHHFESCLAELFQAYELVLGMAGRNFPGKDAAGPEKVLFKLDRIYNTAKHTEHMLVRAQHFKEGDTLAVRISNEGLSSKSHTLSFLELYDCLCGAARAAKILASGDHSIIGG